MAQDGAPDFLKSFVSSAEDIRAITPFIRTMASLFGRVYKRRADKLIGRSEELTKIELNELIERLSIVDQRSVLDILTEAHRLFDRGSQLPALMLTAIVTELEVLYSEVFKWYLVQHPGKFLAIRASVAANDVFGAETLDELREQIIDREIDLAMRKSPRDQILEIESFCNVKLKHVIDDDLSFYEVFERRNVIVHAAGRVSRAYRRNLATLGYEPSAIPALNTKLEIDEAYFESSTRRLVNFGTILGIVVWSKSCPHEGEAQNKFVVDHVFDRVRREAYADAIDFMSKLERSPFKISDKKTEYMYLINKAQCFKWLGQDEKCAEILNREDWSGSAHQFQICVFCLRDDFAEAAKCIRQAGQGGYIKLDYYKDWPVFQRARDNEEFRNAIKEVYGENLPSTRPRRPGTIRALSEQEIAHFEGDELDRQPNTEIPRNDKVDKITRDEEIDTVH